MAKGDATPLVNAKDIKEVRLLLRRPRYIVYGVPIEIVGIPFALTYGAIVLRILTLFFLGDWDAIGSWKLGLYGVATLHILLRLFIYWNVKFASRAQFKPATLQHASNVLVLPTEFSGHPEIVPLQHRTLDDEKEIGFEFRKQRFCWDAASEIFRTLQFPDHETFDTYRKSSGLGSQNKVLTALQRWGPNRFDVPLPPFGSLLKEHLLAPFFVFQTFCVGLWALDEYWYYSLFTLGMLVMFECTVVMQRLRNLKELRSLSTPKQPIQVYRGGKWDQMPGDALLPGDVISIGRPQGEGHAEQVVPADALLLAGTAIVEEAVLTGESTPQWKNPLGTPADEAAEELALAGSDRLSIQRDKAHILFSGTRILQHTGDKEAHIRTPDGGCLAVVLRTGFDTSQGQLMRTILHSTERVTANNWETGLFILFLLIFALAASAYVLYHGLQEEGRSRFKLFLNCSMIITSVIPPELPMELSIAINASLLALARKRVFCTEPFRIVMAGKVDVCCFDKTGTLTSNDMLLEGVAGLSGRGAELLRNVRESALPEVLRVLVGCQSLVYVDGDLVGDPLELAAFNATGWKHEGGAFTSSGSPKETLTIEHRYYFSSALKRMSAVVRLETAGAAAATSWVVAKGAPEVMYQFLASPPADYEESYKQHAAQGSRVIVLAYKQLDSDLGPAELRHLPRSEAESDLTFAGFAVLACPLKPESEPALRELKESSHQLVMITGDTPLTACFAAGRLHIVDRPVLIATHRGLVVRKPPDSEHEPEPDSHFEWVSPDESVRRPFSRERDAVLALASAFDLCLGGEALQHIQQIGAEPLFVPLTQAIPYHSDGSTRLRPM